MIYYKIKPDQYEEIIDMYKNQGMSTSKISAKYNVNRITIARILKNCNVIVGKYQTNNNKIIDMFSKEIQKDIVDLYKNNSITKLMKIYKVERHVINKILKHNKVNIRNRNIERKIYKVKSDYFDNIDNEYKAYFLGLLYADGCNTGKNITITLKEEDAYVLKEFSEKIYYNKRPLYFKNRKKEKQTYKNQYTLCICDEQIRKSLEKIGLVERKSLICNVPNSELSKDMFIHFLRGYFDGDGSVYITKSKNRNYIRICVIGTKYFLNFLVDNIKKYSNININKLYQDSITEKIYYLKMGKKNDIKELYNFLYTNANIFLKRKKLVFEDYYGNIT